MRKTCPKPIKRTIALLVPAFAGLSFSAFAFQPLVTDDTGTQGAGGTQIELTDKSDRAQVEGRTDRSRSRQLVYTRGLSETLDVYAGLSHIWIRSSILGNDVGGSGNPSVGAKWRFFESEECKTSVAVRPVITFPISPALEKAGLGTGKTSGNLIIIITQEVPFGALHANAGVGRNRYRDPSTNPDATLTTASVAPVWDVAERWKLALDMGTESAELRGSKVRSNFVELGAIYSPSNELDFAFGILRSSDNQKPRITSRAAVAGITWRFK